MTEEYEEYNTNTQMDIEAIKSGQKTAEHLYDPPTLNYLLSLLDKEDKAVLLDIYRATSENILNYQKTKVKDYQRLRRKYEITWGKLEAQGFIRPLQVAQLRLYYVTENGKKAVALLEES